jgi:hypothetical protein
VTTLIEETRIYPAKGCWPFTAAFLESGRVGYTTKDKKKTLRFGSQESSYSELIGILITLLEVSAWILRITFHQTERA